MPACAIVMKCSNLVFGTGEKLYPRKNDYFLNVKTLKKYFINVVWQQKLYLQNF